MKHKKRRKRFSRLAFIPAIVFLAAGAYGAYRAVAVWQRAPVAVIGVRVCGALTGVAVAYRDGTIRRATGAEIIDLLKPLPKGVSATALDACPIPPKPQVF